MLPETVGNAKSQIRLTDPLYSKQREDVARMRTSLLSCSEDPLTSKKALANITVLRVYHQVSRIIRYLEMMDKIEDKLYESLDYRIDNMDIENPTTWMMLLNVQEKLQANMVNSHKLLQPYIENINLWKDSMEAARVEQEIHPNTVLTKNTRESIRSAAQTVLALLPVEGEDYEAQSDSTSE